MKYPIRRNSQLSTSQLTCFTCYNYNIPETFAYIFVHNQTSELHEVLLFTDNYRVDQLDFLDRFEFEDLRELVMYNSITAYCAYNMCHMISISRIKEQFENLNIIFNHDHIELELKYENISISDTFDSSKIIVNISILESFKLTLQNLLILNDNVILKTNLVTISKFTTISRFNCNYINHKLKYAAKHQLPKFPNKSTEYRNKLPELIQFFDKILRVNSYNSMRLSFKCISIRTHYHGLSMSIFGTTIDNLKPHDMMYEYTNNIIVNYMFNFILSHPNYQKYLTNQEVQLLKI